MNAPWHVIIVGAGITGIGAAYYLHANNISYTLLEADDDLGGVWHTHRWHGARCDSDFIKYSYSFKPFLSAQCLQSAEQIHRYLRGVAQEFGILQNIRFNTRVIEAVFDLKEKHWLVHTNRGIFTAPFLFNGNGYFADPHIPVFPHADRFKGEIIHTAHLDGSRCFTDKDVVVVGSGSTAVCCAPALSRVAKSLSLIQRSPSYIYEITNKAALVTVLCQELHRIGITFPVKLLRNYLQCKDDFIFVAFRRFPRFARWIFRRHWLGTVGAESVQRHFSPRYNPWEQRIPVAIGLKEKLRNKEISLKTAEIERFTENSVVLSGGENIKCDVCVLATGFNLNLLKFDLYVGQTRITMGGVSCYKRLMIGSVPNYFHPLGVWHSALTQSSETLTKFAIRIMSHMKENGLRVVAVECRELDYKPGITPNYVLRSLLDLPKPYGTHELPALDNLLSFRFDRRDFRFS